MSDHGDGSVLELNSAELEGENNVSSKFKCTLSSDNIPLIMGLNTEYCNNGGTNAGNLGLNLLQNFDESNLFQCDISGVFEWTRQRTDSVSSTDLDCMKIDCNEAIVATSNLTSPSEEQVSGHPDIHNAVPIDTEFSTSVTSNLCQSDTLSSTLLDELTCLQADDQDVKTTESVINTTSMFQYSLPSKEVKLKNLSDSSDIVQKPLLCLKELNSQIANNDNEKNAKLRIVKTALPFVKVPRKCILSGKIIKTDAYSFITKSVIPTLPEQSVIEIPQNIQISQSDNGDIDSASQERFCVEPLCDSAYATNEELNLILPEEKPKLQFIDEPLQTNESRSLLTSNTQDNSDRNNAKTVVAISTNKLEDVTEIVIKTEKGEELYKGKASELLKATNSASNLLLKFDCNVKQKFQQQTSEVEKTETTSEECNTSTGDDDKTDELVTNEDEPITEALKELGITGDEWDNYEIIKGQQRLWVCPLEQCDNLFNKLSTLKIHILTHYKLRPFKCNYTGCEWSFYTNSRLKRHKETHLRKKEFKCPFDSCNRSFTTIYNLQTHLKLHERPADLLCPVSGCGQAFQTRRNMESHLKEHGTAHAPYVCDYIGCEKRYYSPSGLQSHSRTHLHNIEDLRCVFCFKMFDKPCRLKAHLRSHTGVKPYKCNYEGCEWAFTTSSKLNRHQAKHTQERRFSCSLCCKAFLRSEHLKDHTLIHFLTRAFVCPVTGCGQQFSAKSSLYVHIKKHRKKDSDNFKEREKGQKDSSILSLTSESCKLMCPIDGCNHIFSSKNEISSHVQTCHKAVNIEAKDVNTLDSIELMNGDDNLISLEGMQFKNDPTSLTGFSLTNSDGVVVSLPECLLPDYINSTDELTGLSILNTPIAINEIEFSENVENNAKNISSNCDIALNSLTTVTSNCLDIGSARTGITYQDALAERELRKSFNKKSFSGGRKRVSLLSESPLKESNSVQVASDIILTAGLLGGSQENLTKGFMFQDELPNGDFYEPTETTLTDTNSNGGEYLQVFILESTDGRNQEFEQSTINLRDLE